MRFHDGTQDLVFEQALPMMRADGDEIRARLRIIIPAQADGLAVMSSGTALRAAHLQTGQPHGVAPTDRRLQTVPW